MTIPTTNVTLTDIQTEFGGTAPINLSEYYAGGPYVPNPPPTSGSQTGPIPTSGPIKIGFFKGVTKVVAPVYAPWQAESLVGNSVTTSSHDGLIVEFLFNNGQFAGLSDTGDTTITTNTVGTVLSPTYWYSNTPTPGIGNSYWVRCTVTSGTPCNNYDPSYPPGVWNTISGSPYFGYSVNASGPISQSGTFLIEISDSAAGTNILATGSMSIRLTHS
jgi:hypothetical protein